MSHDFVNNPRRIYVNLSASALSSSAQLSQDPEANFYTTRNVPILQNTSKYQLAIVRAAIQGQRNLPLLIASIKTGQPLPYITNYVTTLTLTFGGTPVEIPPSSLPDPPTSRTITINSINAFGVAAGSASVPVPSTSASAAVVAAWLTAAYGTSPDPVISDVTCTVGAGSMLKFARGNPSATPGWSFTVSVLDDDAASFFGFFSAQLAISSLGSLDAAVIALPAPCSYNSTTPVFSTSFAAPMVWIPQTSGLALPAAPLTTQDNTTDAYWLYDYAWFARLLNNTFQTAFSAVVAAAATAGFSLPITQGGTAPSCVYVPAAKGFRLSVPAGLVQGGEARLDIQLNEELSNLMNWPGTYDAVGNETLIWDCAVPGTSSTGGAVLNVTPEYPATGNGWSPVGSIVFGFSQWPARAEILSPPIQYGEGASNAAASSNDETSQILSDVVPQVLDSADFVSQNIISSPHILRWIDLPGHNAPLRTLDFKVGWRNSLTGAILPLTLNPTSSVSIKILLQTVD